MKEEEKFFSGCRLGLASLRAPTERSLFFAAAYERLALRNVSFSVLFSGDKTPMVWTRGARELKQKTEAEKEGENGGGGGREGRHTRSKNSFFSPPYFALTFRPQTLGSARRGPAPATPPASTREREDISASARLDTRGGTATWGEDPASQTGNGTALPRVCPSPEGVACPGSGWLFSHSMKPLSSPDCQQMFCRRPHPPLALQRGNALSSCVCITLRIAQNLNIAKLNHLIKPLKYRMERLYIEI